MHRRKNALIRALRKEASMPILNHHSLPETYKEMCEVARKYDQTRLTVAAGKYRHPTLLKNEGNQAERIFQQLNDLSINLLETTRTMNEMIQDQQRNIQSRRDTHLNDERDRH
ncbi:hypothetical protein BX616_002313 [Lobosporangium transversale]|nr:hypothetical protein BX616_002313 [Lobosporangium transversale]